MSNIAEIEQLMIDAGITELEFRSGATQLCIRRQRPALRMPAAARVDAARADAADAAGAGPQLAIVSRHVGRFQRRHPTRKQPELVQGARVAAGETLGFVRDGLVLYPVVAPRAGVLASIAQADDAPVGYGSLLFEIALTARP